MADQQIMMTARGRVELQDIDAAPAGPGPGQIAGATLVSMISPGTEIQGMLLGERFPTACGYACVIEVEQVGPEVATIRPGDRAFIMGGHRSRHVWNASEAVVLPPGLDAATACLARFMGVSMTTLTTTAARPPGRVLITGLGLVGALAARLFDACGYAVTATDPVAWRREHLASATRCRVADAVPMDGAFDLAVDCSGHEQAVLDAARAVRPGGEVVLVGVPWRRRSDLPAFDLLHTVFHRYVHLRSGWEWELPRQRRPFDRASIQENFAGAVRWLSEGRIATQGLFDRVPPAACQDAYSRLSVPGPGPLTTAFVWS